MFFRSKKLAPEPYLTGALHLQYQVALYIRNCAAEISTEQLGDLGYALHNLPDSLIAYGDLFDEAKIREEFADYDAKWGQPRENATQTINLIATLDSGMEQAKAWLEKRP